MAKNTQISEELLTLLIEATRREMKVSMQYMMQHTLHFGGVIYFRSLRLCDKSQIHFSPREIPEEDSHC